MVINCRFFNFIIENLKLTFRSGAIWYKNRVRLGGIPRFNLSSGALFDRLIWPTLTTRHNIQISYRKPVGHNWNFKHFIIIIIIIKND